MIRVSQQELTRFLENSQSFENKIYDENNFEQDWYFDIDKAWDGIQYILTGKGIAESTKPNILSRAFFSHQILDEEQDLGFGPAQYLTAEQVAETNLEIQKIEIQDIDGADMNLKNIYPGFWDKDEATEFLKDSFKEFKAFYNKATQNNEAILTFLN